MKKKILLFSGIFTGSIAALLIAFYLVVAFSYKGGFTYGTWVNGIYCANKSVDEVNRELINRYNYQNINVSSDYYETETINISDIDFKVDYSESLNNLKNSQNPYNWFKNLSQSYIDSYIYPVVTYDEDKLIDEVDSLKIFDYYNPNNLYKVEIVKDKDGYRLRDDRRLCLESSYLYDNFRNAALNDADIYISPLYFTEYKSSPEMKETLKLWNELEDYIEPRFTIDLGAEQVLIDSSLLSDFLVTDDSGFVRDEEGSFIYSGELIDKYIDNLMVPYNTFGLPRDYETYDGELKHLEQSIYGTIIDISYEKEYIKNAIINKTMETHVPKYIRKGYVRGLDDIGDEFIEVDLTNQKLYYIKDNTVIMDTDIVSGKPSSPTPVMVTYINKKVKNAVLIGEDYVSPVDYWMAIYGTTIGLHDAKWQRAFGGDRYLRYGSHGCVNMQYDDVSSLFDMVEVGIPVIVYK